MTQKHYAQIGTFHITTNAKNKVPWLVMDGVPEILVDNLMMTKRLYGGKVYAFCILPDHMHIVVSPGEKGLSRFIQSFKCQSSRDIHLLLGDMAPKPVAESRGSPLRVLGRPCFTGWQKGFHDERIRDNDQRIHALRYVRGNAHHHHLVDEPHDWPWTSHYFEHLLDPLEVWFR